MKFFLPFLLLFSMSANAHRVEFVTGQDFAQLNSNLRQIFAPDFPDQEKWSAFILEDVNCFYSRLVENFRGSQARCINNFPFAGCKFTLKDKKINVEQQVTFKKRSVPELEVFSMLEKLGAVKKEADFLNHLDSDDEIFYKEPLTEYRKVKKIYCDKTSCKVIID